MQIQKVQNNFNRKQNISNVRNINFQAGKSQLVAVSSDSFKSECAKKLYSKIQRYFQLIGESGSIKDKKILQEKASVCLSKPPYIIEVDADVCLSINKGERNSTIKLYHKYSDSKYKDATILEATLDKNGQMFSGRFLPVKTLNFERDKRNTRRMFSHYTGITYMPVGGNDKDWSCLDTSGSRKLSSHGLVDESEKGAFEIFLELARLKTSIV
jgi:hypothetical protein